ncbi:MAG TPA: trehalase family glycosidase [Acidobacteriaceae bacterium]|nr:trehalase family glycosidase [Acidobacteriaceae bacterium]
MPSSAEYQQLQKRLASGWNTWDVHSVTTQVLLPDGLAIHMGLKHNSTEFQDAYLGDALIGRQTKGAEQVFPGPHSWSGSYTDLRLSWKGHSLRLQTAHDGDNLVMLATPLPSQPLSVVPPTIAFSVNYLWNRPGSVVWESDHIEAHSPLHTVKVYCTCAGHDDPNFPLGGAYFTTDFAKAVGVSTGTPLGIDKIKALIERASAAYTQSNATAGKAAAVADAIQTVLGWDTIYEPEGRRVISPVSRVWSVNWGGYVIFDWDTFFAATMASIGDRDLAYANAIETLREETQQGFVPNYARSGNWKSSDRSEPPVGSITVLGIYQRFHDKWFLKESFTPLLRWNQWWAEHRDIQGYLTWGSDGENQPADLDDTSRGTRAGAILESGLDNSPMYDSTTYDAASHKLEFADVGLMSMYIADCDALATIADTLGETGQAREIRARGDRYRSKLATLWDSKTGIFLNKDLHTGEFSERLSPTNFYPLLAKAATPQQAEFMVKNHLLNPKEFWGQWVIPSIARDDPAFKDQEYWRGRIWGPMNYLVYLGLRNYNFPDVTREFAQKSYDLFLQEWRKNGHVHENYNAITGTGDDVTSSDRFYHWGALLGYIQYLQQTEAR